MQKVYAFGVSPHPFALCRIDGDKCEYMIHCVRFIPVVKHAIALL